MLEDARRELIAKIHARPVGMVIAITGGGSQAIGHLLSVPGGSRTVLEAIVPYSSEALDDFLGTRPEHYCTEHTARLMAMAAFQRARDLYQRRESARIASQSHDQRLLEAQVNESIEQTIPASTDPREMRSLNSLDMFGPIGIGCTASLVSDRPKRGDHRIHVAWHGVGAAGSISRVLRKGARDRDGEESVAADMVLNAIAMANKVGRLEISGQGDVEEEAFIAAPQEWKELLLGQREHVAQRGAELTAATTNAGRKAVFPGAFNPRHRGHDHMRAIAERRLGIPVDFELSIQNVDKPLLDYIEISKRLEQFTPTERVWLTVAPRFIDKARILGPTTFIVGADTIRRIGDAHYYDGDTAKRDEAIQTLADRDARFLVFGRKEGDEFHSLGDLTIPPALRALCDEVPESEFREDISSTELRKTSAEN